MFACLSCFNSEGEGSNDQTANRCRDVSSTIQADETKKWLTELSVEDAPFSSNLLKILTNESLLTAFRYYLEDCYCAENLNFILAVDEYKDAEEEERLQIANRIFDEYLTPDSEKEVSLGSYERDAIRRSLDDSRTDGALYDAARQHVAMTLQLEHVRIFNSRVNAHFSAG